MIEIITRIKNRYLEPMANQEGQDLLRMDLNDLNEALELANKIKKLARELKLTLDSGLRLTSSDYDDINFILEYLENQQ